MELMCFLRCSTIVNMFGNLNEHVFFRIETSLTSRVMGVGKLATKHKLGFQ